MKVKTSVTLSPAVIDAIDKFRGDAMARSTAIELIVMESLREKARAEHSAAEIERLNAVARRDADEKAAFMQDQAPWWEKGSELPQ